MGRISDFYKSTVAVGAEHRAARNRVARTPLAAACAAHCVRVIPVVIAPYR